jgi:DNA-K related protein
LDLTRRLLGRLSRMASAAPGQLDAWIWAVGRLCSRSSLSGDPTAVLPPVILPELLAAFRPLKFGALAPVACAALTQAFRRIDEPVLDASPDDRAAALVLLSRLSGSVAQQERVRDGQLRDEAADVQALAGERLPAGLVFARTRP